MKKEELKKLATSLDKLSEKLSDCDDVDVCQVRGALIGMAEVLLIVCGDESEVGEQNSN